jgi:TldD protein
MINDNLIADVLAETLAGGDFAEVFIEDSQSGNLEMNSGRIDRASSGRARGIGIRGFSGKKAIHAYTSDLGRDSVIAAARRVAAALRGRSKKSAVLEKTDAPPLHIVAVPPFSVENGDKAEVMRVAYRAARDYSPVISEVQIHYIDVDQEVTIANSEGLYTTDRRVRTRLIVRAIATKDGRRESGHVGPGAAYGFELFDDIDVSAYGREAARIAAQAVEADYAPAGKMPVIIANAFGGVIFHEACGHALEATSVAKGSSVFTGKMGERIASEVVSAVDDGRIPHAWGSSRVDDEGTPTRRTTLIENGVLKSYMVDRLGGRRMDCAATGNGRRQNYTFAPTSRMTNTFILPGNYVPAQIIAATDRGLYAKTLGGGQVNTATGEFNFEVAEGYLIEGGKIVKPLRGATLVGKGHEILTEIDMVGNDLARGQGNCGSISGSIPADVGQPTLRVKEMTVGGRT